MPETLPATATVTASSIDCTVAVLKVPTPTLQLPEVCNLQSLGLIMEPNNINIELNPAAVVTPALEPAGLKETCLGTIGLQMFKRKCTLNSEFRVLLSCPPLCATGSYFWLNEGGLELGTKTASGTSKFACNRLACVFNDFFDSARVIPTPHPPHHPGNAFNSIMSRGVPWHIIFLVVASGK